jgi:hypothetical protein
MEKSIGPKSCATVALRKKLLKIKKNTFFKIVLEIFSLSKITRHILSFKNHYTLLQESLGPELLFTKSHAFYTFTGYISLKSLHAFLRQP